jgi:NADH-quinone oxidoreductase subunit A
MMAAISAALIHLIPAAEAAPVVAAAAQVTSAPVVVMGPSVFDMVFPLTMLLILGLVVPAALLGINELLSRFVAHGTRNTNKAKNEPYESGLPVTVGTAGERFDVKFYLIAMLFLAFDIEVAFLYPWAVHFATGGWEMIAVLVVFLVLLEVGYLYLYKKGALDWDK